MVEHEVYRAIVVISLATVTLCETTNATVTAAQRGKFSGVVKVSGKTPNATLDVEQSANVGGGGFVDTGFDIMTDGTGKGKIRIPNVASGTLLCGHIVRVGGAGGNTREVVYVKKWFPGLFARSQVLTDIQLAQSVSDDPPLALLETWDAGSEWILRLDPSEASWFDAGASLSTEGDLDAQLISVTSQDITIGIIDDPTFATDDTIHITGIGINVVAGVTELHPQIGLLGSTSYYIDGEAVGTENTVVPTFVAATTIPLISGGVPAVSEWSLTVLTLLGLCAGTIMFGRRWVAQHGRRSHG